MSNNVTYFLGAGASKNAFPILSCLSNSMHQFAIRYIKVSSRSNFSDIIERKQLSEREKLIWDIGYFGMKGTEFGTVDTYARRLFLNLNHTYEELNRLKTALSNFFTIWQYSNDLDQKNTNNYEFIDKRYISLFATILEATKNDNPIVPNNINFITWNYDLQLELAYKLFLQDQSTTLDDVNKIFSFNFEEDYGLRICHLNGFHGYYQTKIEQNDESIKNKNVLNRINVDSVDNLIDKLSFTIKSTDNNNISFNNFISYAWDSNTSKIGLETKAMEIMQNTETLVIIGYSFPNFNKKIDRTLFSSLNNSKLNSVIYQDPKPKESILRMLIPFGHLEPNITVIKNTDYFYFPY